MGKLKTESDTPNKLEADIDTFQHQTALLRYVPRVDEREIYERCRMFYLRARQMVSADAPAPPADMMDGTVAESYLFRLREFIRASKSQKTMEGQNDPRPKPDPFAVAATLKTQDRKLSVRKAAQAVGVHYSKLQRDPLWQTAAELAKKAEIGTTPKHGNGMDDPADDRENDPTDIGD